MHHYRCFRCFVPSTGKETNTDTLRFLPRKIPFPHVFLQDRLVKAVQKIITILQNIEANKLPAVPNKFTLEKSFQQVETILTNEKQLKSTGNNL